MVKSPLIINMATYNKYYETWFRGNNTVPATYGNVSIYTTGKTDLKGGITTTNLAINKNNTSNSLDVSGNVVFNKTLNVGGDTFINGGLEAIGNYFLAIPTANNPKGYGISVDNTGFVASGSNLQYLLPSFNNADFNNKFRISGQSSIGVRDYLLVEPKDKSLNTNELKATISGDMTITNGNLTIGSGGNALGFTKSMVGLGNVDNTSDANKPISIATQDALNLRAFDASCVHLTGNESIAGSKTFIGELIPTRNINATSISIGANSLQYRQATSTNNVGIGQNTIRGNTTTTALNTGKDLIAIGVNSLQLAEDISSCIMIGSNTGAQSRLGVRFFNNIAIGNESMNQCNNTTNRCDENVLIGHNTGQRLGLTNLSYRNVGIGNNTFKTTQYSFDSVAIGHNVLPAGGSNTTAVGFNALGNSTSNDNMTAYGGNAGQFNNYAYNVYFGSNCGQNTGNSFNGTKAANTFLGTSADLAINAPWNNSVALGFNSRVSTNNTICMGGVYGSLGLPRVMLPAKNLIYTCSTLSTASNAMTRQYWTDTDYCYGDTILLTSVVSSITLPRTTNTTQFSLETAGGAPTSIGLRYTFVKNYVSPLTSVSITPFNAFERILDLNSGSMLSSITMGTNIRSLSLVNVDFVLNPTSAYISWICYSRDIDTTIFPQLSANNSFTGSNSFTTLPTCSATPTTSNQFTTKTYVDNAISGYFPSGVPLLSADNVFTANNTFSGITTFTADISANSVLISPLELSYLNNLTDNIQTQLNGKQATGNYATIDTAQTISGSKTFSGTTTFTGDISANSVLISPTELSYLDGVSSNIQTQLNGKQATGNYASTDLSNTFIQLNTFSNGLTLSSGTLTLPSESIDDTALSSNVMLADADNVMSGSISINDGATAKLNINGGSGITLYNGTPFYFYTGATTSSPVFFSLDYTSDGMDYYGTSANFNNSNINIKNASGLRHGGWNTTKLDLSNCLLQIEEMNVAHANTGTITGAITLSKPFNQYYAVESTSTAYTITLPTITAKEMGKEIVFRKVKQGASPQTISFIGNGTQKVYNTELVGGATAQGLMTSSVYIVKLVALLDATTGGAYGWFQSSSFGNLLTTDTTQSILGAKTFSSTLTLTGGLTASGTQTITFSSNAVSMGTCQPTGINVASSSQTINGGITFPNTDVYRKIVLYPVVNNAYQNYSIGAHNTNGEMMFLVPDSGKIFKFAYATSTTAKQDILSLSSSGLTLSVGTLTLPNTSISDSALSSNVPLKNGTNTFTGTASFTNATATSFTYGITSPSVKNAGALTIQATSAGDVSISTTDGDVSIMGYGTNKGVRFPTNGTYSNIFISALPTDTGGSGLMLKNGQVMLVGSTRDIKTNITEIADDDPVFNLETFMKLKPSFFHSKNDVNQKQRFIGFIAEEIYELGLKELNIFKDDELTELSGVYYEYFTAYLVKAVQLQQKTIQSLKDQLNTQQQQIDDLITILKSKSII